MFGGVGGADSRVFCFHAIGEMDNRETVVTTIDEVIVVQVARLNELVLEIKAELVKVRRDLDEIRSDLDILRPPEEKEDLILELTGQDGDQDA